MKSPITGLTSLTTSQITSKVCIFYLYGWYFFTNLNIIKELQLGELLHDDMFGLLEAMSAIEMMDPKMDAGMVCNRGSKKALTFEQAVEVCNFIGKFSWKPKNPGF